MKLEVQPWREFKLRHGEAARRTGIEKSGAKGGVSLLTWQFSSLVAHREQGASPELDSNCLQGKEGAEAPNEAGSLAARIAELSGLLRQNEELRQRLESASRRATEDTELQLRRLGADLHDGPAQLLALALLKLDLLPEGSAESPGEREMIRSILRDAMSEIRDISAGLALPTIDRLSLAQALIVVATEHERRTSTRVSCEFPTGSIDLPHTTKLCLCRFVQEGLSNAFKHAGGVGQTVSASWTDTSIEVAVGDAGPGLNSVPGEAKRPALGLIGLHSRLESLGGRLTITGQVGGGTRLTAYLPVGAGGK